MQYSSFGLLSLILTMIINHDIIFKRRNNALFGSKYYHWFIITVIAYYVSDILWGLLYQYKLATLTYIDTIFYFILMAISILLWTLFIFEYLGKKNIFTKIITIGVWIFTFYQVVSLIVNYFVPFSFFYNEQEEYIALDSRYITYGFIFLFFSITSMYALLNATATKGKQKTHYITIGVSGLSIMIATIFQLFYPLLPFYAIGCLLATCLVHVFITEEVKKDQNIQINSANLKAYTDSLTGVKSSYAYSEKKEECDRLIQDGKLDKLAVVMFDLNDLKYINDTEGHDAGDNYLKASAKLICNVFKHSPVYRIGGDEFITFLSNDDYDNRLELMKIFENQINENIKNHNHLIVASGMSKYNPKTDNVIKKVVIRADRLMYERKAELTRLKNNE